MNHHELFDAPFLALLERLHLLAKRLAGGAAAGQRRARRLGDGLEFADHRDYAPGDDIRFIDWPYYARMEKILLRLFHEHNDAEVTILLDCSASMAGEKFTYARRTAAALAYVAMGGLERVTIQPFADELASPLRTGRNRGQILHVLDYLAALAPAGQTHLDRCTTLLTARPELSGTVLLLGDLLDCSESLSDACLRLRQRCEPTVIHIYGAEDAEPTLRGQMLLRAAESEQEMSLDLTPELLASYRARWEEFRHGCEHAVLARGAIYVAAPTALPFEKLVLQTLRQAGVLN